MLTVLGEYVRPTSVSTVVTVAGGDGRCGTLGGVATLYVRDVPDELQHRLRVCAAMGDETMKSLVLRALERECDRIEAQAGGGRRRRRRDDG